MKNDYEIRGDETVIFLRRRDGTIVETIIDTVDFPKVDAFSGRWYASPNNGRRKPYVTIECHRVRYHLSRIILDTPNGLVADHINQNTLDNRRSNLRIATIAQNAQNQMLQRRSSSGVRGVYYQTDRKKWHATIKLNGKKKFLGLYDTLEEAEKVTKNARKEYMPFSQEAMGM